ncbi:hypothetical protein [Frankia sp. KB5]|uniref:hypothetical protein n=1 Tax=Frankia sp. KB5 TaxID=683318 RepID=UPI000A0F7546|nr:hypothetical protein [Frankia sp. KB5]ORT47189.1 hypothetical protein KBI5_21160 [Frankia sp. KB5]
MTPTTTLLALPLLPTLTVTLGYTLACWIKPFGPCRRCDGTARTTSRFGRSRPCRHCDHTGLRLRLGRRGWNWARRTFLPSR